jgi:hypothetical protein
MSITSISRITHRKGFYEDLPQLANGELGWAVDERRLFIGNDPVWSPDDTNHYSSSNIPLQITEVLTEHSNLLALNNSYRYSGFSATGYEAESTVARSLQDKLDEHVSIKDYGALGDGTTDDTAAINDALFDLYCRSSVPQVRRELFFPAGTYVVTSVIKIPPYAYLRGEGRLSTVIEYQGPDDSTPPDAYAFVVSDSDHEIEPGDWQPASIKPTHIRLIDIGLSTLADNNLFLAQGLQSQITGYSEFINVRFSGSGRPSGATQLADPWNALTAELGCNLFTARAATLQTFGLAFDRCEFTQGNYAVLLHDQTSRVNIRNSVIFECQYGVVGTADSRSVRLVDSVLRDLTANPVWFGPLGERNRTFYNTFAYNAKGAVIPEVTFLSAGNIAVGDVFFYDNDPNLGPHYELQGPSIAIDAGDKIRVGTYTRESGDSFTLLMTANIPTPWLTIDNTGGPYDVFKMDYSIKSGGKWRTGLLTVAAVDDSTSPIFSDDYVENSDLGFEFSTSASGSDITIEYTATAAVADGALTYSITKMI